MRNRQSLDYIIPEDMKSYLEHYGKHFSKKMFEFAFHKMHEEEDPMPKPITKDDFNSKLNAYGIKVMHDCMYDGMYVFEMAKSDFYRSSLEDEHHLFKYVKDYVDDKDAVDGQIFNRFYADCNIKGIPIDWESMI